jgi:hypothetical protein
MTEVSMEPKKLPTVKANAICVRDQPISSPMGFTQMLSTAPYIGAEANEMSNVVAAMPQP